MQVYLYFTSSDFFAILLEYLLKKRGWSTLNKFHLPLHTMAEIINLPRILMIIDFAHSFKNYHEILSFYGIWDYDCPKCKAHNHPFYRHAKYSRNLILWENGSLSEQRMEILRLRCHSCGSTHAVLTLDMIPFITYSIGAFLNLMLSCMMPDGSIQKTERDTGVSFQLLCRFLHILREYTDKLVLFLRQQGLWEQADHPSELQTLQFLIRRPPPWPQSAFFALFRIPLFMNRRNTLVYPLRFFASLPPVSSTHIASESSSGSSAPIIRVSNKKEMI